MQNNCFKETQWATRKHRDNAAKSRNMNKMNLTKRNCKKEPTEILELKNKMDEIKCVIENIRADFTKQKNQWYWRQELWNYPVRRDKRKKKEGLCEL